MCWCWCSGLGVRWLLSTVFRNADVFVGGVYAGQLVINVCCYVCNDCVGCDVYRSSVGTLCVLVYVLCMRCCVLCVACVLLLICCSPALYVTSCALCVVRCMMWRGMMYAVCLMCDNWCGGLQCVVVVDGVCMVVCVICDVFDVLWLPLIV